MTRHRFTHIPCRPIARAQRVWLLRGRGELEDNPITFAIKNRISLLFGALLTAAFVAAVPFPTL